MRALLPCLLLLAVLAPPRAEAGPAQPEQRGAPEQPRQEADEEVPLEALPPIRAAQSPPAAMRGQDEATASHAARGQRALAGVDDEPSDPALEPDPADMLYLEVLLNGHPTNLVGEFLLLPGNRFALRVREMRELGMRPPRGASDEDIIVLDDIANGWSYDETRQRIDIQLSPEDLRPEVFDLAAGGGARLPEVSDSGTGMVLNYSLLASARARGLFTDAVLDGVSANLEGWIYSPLGTVFSSGFVRSDGLRAPRAVRLQSGWRFVDLRRSMDYTLGDVITRGPSWARAVRLGGVRVARSFRLRPDVVTMPLPSLSGTAAVPTTIDVYVNNIRVHSGQVQPGPFEITNIPAISNAGVARLVMRDASGREIVSERRFFVSPRLMRRDMLEFSVEAGVPRLDYGTESFSYAWRHPGLSASVRYGLRDDLTVQAHAEAARRLALVGAGAVFSLFDQGVMTIAGAVSHSRQGTGFLGHAALQASILGMTLNARYTRAWKDYHDLASVSASATTIATAGAAIVSGANYPREVASVSLGRAISTLGANVSLSLLHAVDGQGARTDTLGLSYSQNVWGDASLYLHVFSELDDLRAPSISAGLTVPLGGRGTVSSSGTYDVAGRYRAALSYDSPLGLREGAVGWKARVTYGDLKAVQASLAWRSSVATVRGTALGMNGATMGQLGVSGALVLADGALFATNRIHDAFAVVNAGAAGVKVRHENREVGTTRADGRLLVPSLRSLQRNKISIDAQDVPVDMMVESDTRHVVPGVRAGVVVDFKPRRLDDAALVVFVDAGGRPLEPGSEVRLGGVDEVFVVGYDGETFLQGLKSDNEVRIATPQGECRATFAFTPGDGGQNFIGPVPCRP